MMIKDNLKPIVMDLVQEKINDDEFQNLEKGYKDHDLDFTENDRRMYLFKEVFASIRGKDDYVKMERMLEENDALGLFKKIMEQSRYIIHLEEAMLETLYTEEDLTMVTADFSGNIDIKSTELADLIMECIQESL